MVWNDIVNTFDNVMKTKVTGSRTYHSASSTTDLKSLPASIFDGSYSVKMTGIGEVRTDINQLYLIPYEVRLTYGQVLNQNRRDSYDSGSNDLEEIIRQSMRSTNWSGSLEEVRMIGASVEEFAPTSGEVYQFTNCDFTILSRSTLP